MTSPEVKYCILSFRMEPLPPIEAWDQEEPRPLSPRSSPICPFCGPCHSLGDCPQFIRLSPANRLSIVLGNGLCINCLAHPAAGWPVVRCHLKAQCSCQAPHHPMLHDSRRVMVSPPQSPGIRASFRGRRPLPATPHIGFLHPRSIAPGR
ncbi:unnamed protein product [Bemisia tabaci]|uniref:Uncharacterized protein n=1 Tax=Bemisia tabaci TaxID=7038 RepID=A0A9P0ANL2_BEMTA|nr:unnamed protein product [Bemisia tabaci]